MKKIFILLILAFSSVSLFSQKLKDGNYTFNFFDKEYNKVIGICEVKIQQDSIFVFAKNGCHVKEGELLAKGILLKHKSGKWIIAKSSKDKYAKEIGVYADKELFIIDLKKKIFYSA